MKELLKSITWFSGFQWLFFIFTNTIIIPLTVGAAFGFSPSKIVNLLQLSFILTGIACMLQAFFGHKRAIMEGQSGLWWGVILTLCYSASAQGMSLTVMGGSLSVGIIISAILTVIIGLTGMGPFLSKLFNPAVMGVFIFLLGCKLVSIFLRGMLGIPFGNQSQNAHIDLAISLLSIVIAIIVIVMSVKAPPVISQYSLLIGIIIGWIIFAAIFKTEGSIGQISSYNMDLFPLGQPTLDIGVIIATVLTGLLNISNTFGALKGTDSIYNSETTNSQYRSSFTITGLINILAGIFGLVPYAPYVSSIGFLSQTRIIKRIPFILGGFMFFLMGVIPQIGYFFSKLPLSIGSAVLFVAYLQLLNSSWKFFQQIELNTFNVYRLAVPLFVGIMIMTLPISYFETLPSFIRPLLSSGLLVGIMLALLLENLLNWDQFGKIK